MLAWTFGDCHGVYNLEIFEGVNGLQLIKAINTSAAIGLDSNEHEVVVFGKGIGFPKMPYELTDLTRIERTFYDVEPRYLETLSGLQEPILMASADLVEQAEINLDCSLNPNLPFTLADHLQFAMERVNQGIEIAAPLAYDVQHLYPDEYELGELALDILQDYTGCRLPQIEATNVALHLINAELEAGDSHAVMQMLGIIEEVDEIVEQNLHIKLDKESFHYSRFTMHLRYLFQRLATGAPLENTSGGMLRTLAREYPDVYFCARKVVEHLQRAHNWHCSEDETLYLMLHIHRVQNKDSE